MVKLKLLSKNLVTVIKEMLNNQNLCRYLYYTDGTPLDGLKPDVDGLTLLKQNVFPVPFDPRALGEDRSEVRVYYARGNIKDIVVEDLKLNFDIIVAKNLWFVDDELIRPYEIMQEIVNTFFDKSIDTVGKLEFGEFRHLDVNEAFNAIQFQAKIIQFTKGK